MATLQELAAAVGDPKPPYHGGPDSKAMIAWGKRWAAVERALRIGAAANRLADAVQAAHPPPHSELGRALDEFNHHKGMATYGY